MLARVLEGGVNPVPHRLIHHARNTDATGLGQRLNASGDIDALTVNILTIVDDVAQVDAHAEVKRAVRQPLLHRDRAGDSLMDRRKLGQEAVTRVFDDATGMLGDGGVDDVSTGGFPSGDGAVRVLLDKPRIACDIGSKNRR